jgi:hypothetical protein
MYNPLTPTVAENYQKEQQITARKHNQAITGLPQPIARRLIMQLADALIALGERLHARFDPVIPADPECC